MTQKQIERVAYIVAHQILTQNRAAQKVACPGAIQSHEIDKTAGLIQGVFELTTELESVNRPEPVALQEPIIARRNSVLH